MRYRHGVEWLALLALRFSACILSLSVYTMLRFPRDLLVSDRGMVNAVVSCFSFMICTRERWAQHGSIATVTGADNEQQNELAQEIPHRISLILFILSDRSPSSLSTWKCAVKQNRPESGYVFGASSTDSVLGVVMRRLAIIELGIESFIQSHQVTMKASSSITWAYQHPSPKSPTISSPTLNLEVMKSKLNVKAFFSTSSARWAYFPTLQVKEERNGGGWRTWTRTSQVVKKDQIEHQ